MLLEAGIAISMDGRGAWRDNVFVERLWRSVKYKEIYLHAYDTVSTARASIDRTLHEGGRDNVVTAARLLMRDMAGVCSRLQQEVACHEGRLVHED